MPRRKQPPPPTPADAETPPPRRLSSMAELARLANVSESTVSRALAGHAAISKATRQRLEALAAAHGYRVHSSASRLRTRRAQTIGIVLPMGHGLEQYGAHPFLLGLLAGIGDVLTQRGLDLLLVRHSPDIESLARDVLDSGRADGLIVLRQSTLHPLLNAVSESYRNLVVWGQRLPDQHYIAIGSDNQAGGQLATRHLIACGCRRIAYVGDRALPEYNARYQGYQRALREAGMAPLDLMARYSRHDLQQTMTRALAAGAEFDGVMAASDTLAIGALQALRAEGRRVPDEVQVVGFDDIPSATIISPSLTTVRQDVVTGARLLVDHLLDRIAGRDAPSTELPVQLVVRESTRPR